ncbi:hypothetical protein EDD86DRAFT_198858 [Gorgonomyces haynaldii]|nr:hypothetical protein EDD86DRAFT_198858 [Gorgonomyces haynaldii]
MTSGWQSERFCQYPQQLVVQFNHLSRLSKIQILCHHYKIPTRIELLYSDQATNHGLKPMGYISMGDNKDKDYKVRELKTIHVDCVAKSLQLVFHKCHVNHLNLYNQVGIVALNVIGEPIADIAATDSLLENPVLKGMISRSVDDDPMTLHDLGFTMEHDRFLVKAIAAVVKEKEICVRNDDFAQARVLKQLQENFTQQGKELSTLLVRKAQVVQLEDYESAMQYQQKIQSIKERLMQRLTESGFRVDKNGTILVPSETQGFDPVSSDKEPDFMPTSRKTRKSAFSPEPVKYQYDQRVRSPEYTRIKSPDPVFNRVKSPIRDASPVRQSSPARQPSPVRRSPERKPTEKVQIDSQAEEIEEVEEREPSPDIMESRDSQQKPLNVDDIPIKRRTPIPDDTQSSRQYLSPMPDEDQEPLPLDPLTEEQEETYALALSVFGEETLAQLLSLHWSHKSVGIQQVMSLLKAKVDNETMRATFQVIGFLMDDGREPAAKMTLELLSKLLQSCKSDSQVIPQLKPLIGPLWLKCADMKPRVAQLAARVVEKMSQQFHQEGATVLPLLIKNDPAKPLEGLPWKHIKTRLEIVQSLVKTFGFSDAKNPKACGWSSNDLTKFCKPFLEHTNDKVRSQALSLMAFIISQSNKDKLNTEQLRPQTVQTLQSELDKLMGSKSVQLQRQQTPKKRIPSQQEKPAETMDEHLQSSCVFCGLKKRDFEDEDKLDEHYWNECPLLMQCPQCHQAVEIVDLNQHLLKECESRNKMRSCPRCKQVLLKETVNQHIKDKQCKGTDTHSSDSGANMPLVPTSRK